MYDKFTFADGEDQEDTKTLFDKFEEHFVPKTNITLERYIFYQRCQFQSESIDQFVTVLK